jgi:hypothetical protein
MAGFEKCTILYRQRRSRELKIAVRPPKLRGVSCPRSFSFFNIPRILEVATPDVILASGGAVVGPLLQATASVPIVFTQTPDPVAGGFVASLARPGGNATGFTQVEYGMATKWLELLKELAPHVTGIRSRVDSRTSRRSARMGDRALKAV